MPVIETVEGKKQTKVDLTKKEVVYSTDKDPHHVTGSEFKVHPRVAEKLIKNGMATSSKVPVYGGDSEGKKGK